MDPGTFAVLDAALDEVLDRCPDHLIVDLTGLVFCSSRGIAAIAQTARAVAANGIRYSMSGASPPFARLWPRYWPDDEAPGIHRTTAAAVLSAVALQADLWNPAPTAGSERPPRRERTRSAQPAGRASGGEAPTDFVATPRSG